MCVSSLWCILMAAGATFTNNAGGAGTGQIWLDNLNCRGSESRLFDCPANQVGVHNCVHSEDASITCTTGN